MRTNKQELEEIRMANVEPRDLGENLRFSPFEPRDELTPQEAKRIDAEARRIRASKTSKIAAGVATIKRSLTRRAIFQTWAAMEKALDNLWDFRGEAREKRRLDESQYLTAAIFHMKRARAYLEFVSQREFHKDPEDLEAYK